MLSYGCGPAQVLGSDEDSDSEGIDSVVDFSGNSNADDTTNARFVKGLVCCADSGPSDE